MRHDLGIGAGRPAATMRIDEAMTSGRLASAGHPLAPEMAGAVLGGAEADGRCRAGSHAGSHHLTAQSDDPEEDRQHDRADDVAPGQPVARRLARSRRRNPREMAEAAEQMVDQRPGKAEEDQQPEPGAEEPLTMSKESGPLAAAISHQASSSHAEIERPAGDAMHDRHHHRQLPAVDRRMRRKRAVRLQIGGRHSPRSALAGNRRPAYLAPMPRRVKTREPFQTSFQCAPHRQAMRRGGCQ